MDSYNRGRRRALLAFFAGAAGSIVSPTRLFASGETIWREPNRRLIADEFGKAKSEDWEATAEQLYKDPYGNYFVSGSRARFYLKNVVADNLVFQCVMQLRSWLTPKVNDGAVPGFKIGIRAADPTIQTLYYASVRKDNLLTWQRKRSTYTTLGQKAFSGLRAYADYHVRVSAVNTGSNVSLSLDVNSESLSVTDGGSVAIYGPGYIFIRIDDCECTFTNVAITRP